MFLFFTLSKYLVAVEAEPHIQQVKRETKKKTLDKLESNSGVAPPYEKVDEVKLQEKLNKKASKLVDSPTHELIEDETKLAVSRPTTGDPKKLLQPPKEKKETVAPPEEAEESSKLPVFGPPLPPPGIL